LKDSLASNLAELPMQLLCRLNVTLEGQMSDNLCCFINPLLVDHLKNFLYIVSIYINRNKETCKAHAAMVEAQG
jgi:hypothetical protein